MIVKIHHQSQKSQQYAYAQKKISVYVGRKSVQELNEGQESIVIDQPTASRKHLLIKLRKNKIYVKDLNSSNGTKINGEEIEADQFYQLNVGDSITIGQSTSNMTAVLRQQEQGQQDSSEGKRERSRQKRQRQFNISESTLKMLKQMKNDKKTKSEITKFLKLMGCKNIDQEWQEIEKYLKKSNRFPTSGKKTNQELQKQFSSGRANAEKSGLGASGKFKSK